MLCFGKDTMLAANVKLGLCPVDVEKACEHPRVRDDTDEGTRGSLIAGVERQHETSMIAGASSGLNSAVFAVPARQRSKALADITAPSSYEEAFAKLVTEGVSVSSVWINLGAKAYNSAEVLGAELQRQQLQKEARLNIEAKKTVDFVALRASAREIEESRIAMGAGYGDLPAAKLTVLVRYAFRARGEKGITALTSADRGEGKDDKIHV